MLDVEDQIRQLADASFDATSPVAFTPRTVDARRPQRLLTIAASMICLVGLGGLVVITATRDKGAPAVQRFAVANPLAINLEGAIEISTQQRVDAIGPLLSFDYEQLPDAWESSVSFTIANTATPPEYWQQVNVTSPDRIAFVVNVRGQLDGGAPGPRLANDAAGGDAVDVRGQPGHFDAWSLQWIEQGEATVEILGAPGAGIADVRDEMLELARLLVPVREELEWGSDGPRLGPSVEDSEPLLAGTLAGTPWRVVTTASGLKLAAGDDLVALSSGSPLQDSDIEIGYSIEPIMIPGGVVVYGDAPASANHVQLRTENSISVLPTAPTADGRIVFAVPVDDRLDPVGIDFLDDEDRVLVTIVLADLPPYLGGSIGSSTFLADDE